MIQIRQELQQQARSMLLSDISEEATKAFSDLMEIESLFTSINRYGLLVELCLRAGLLDDKMHADYPELAELESLAGDTDFPADPDDPNLLLDRLYGDTQGILAIFLLKCGQLAALKDALEPEA